jgi:hypothetical protein
MSVTLTETPPTNEQPLFEISCVAGENLSAHQFGIVKALGWDAATGSLVIGRTAYGEKPLGILQDDPALGQSCNVMVEGKSIVRIGAAIALQDSWVSDANGFAIPKSSPVQMGPNTEWVGGQFIGAYALSATVTGCEMGMTFVGCLNPWENY